MWFSEYIFLERSWSEDKNTLKAGFENLRDFPMPFWLAVFVEGTRFTHAKLLAAQEYAIESKLPVPKRVLIPRTKAESSMNAQAVKKFVEENRRLAMECDDLLSRCHKWEDECSMYDCDIQVLMDFGNEADEKAKVAESRVCYLEEELSKLMEELQAFKQKAVGQKVGTLADNESTEHLLIDTLLSTLIDKDDVASTAHSFLEANSEIDVSQKMLKMWDSLSPSTREVLALASEVKKLHKDKDLLRINLMKAEEEVTVLFDENNILEKENRKLTKLLQKEQQLLDSGGKHSSESINTYKRKSSPCPDENSPIEKKKTDFSDAASSPRQALSPLLHNK